MLRVLFVSPHAARSGGAEIILWNLLNALDRARIEPAVIFLADGPFVDEVREIGIRADVVPADRLRDVRRTVAVTRSLARLIGEHRPDVLINWSAKAHIYGAPAWLLLRRRPLLLWWQQMVPDGHWIDRAATAMPVHAIGSWSGVAARAQRRMRPHHAAFVVHPGVPDPGLPSSSERAAARAQLGIPPSRKVLVLVGRLQPWKRQDRFLRALAHLQEHKHDVHGVVVGGAAFGLSLDYAESLAPLADELGIGERVLFTGQVEDVTPYLRAADVLVSATDIEPFGNVLIEAMAHGVAVVAVAGGGPSEIVVNGVSGVLTSTSEHHELATALAGLLGDDRKRMQIAAAGRERFLDAFTVQAMASKLVDELERLRASRRGISAGVRTPG